MLVDPSENILQNLFDSLTPFPVVIFALPAEYNGVRQCGLSTLAEDRRPIQAVRRVDPRRRGEGQQGWRTHAQLRSAVE